MREGGTLLGEARAGSRSRTSTWFQPTAAPSVRSFVAFLMAREFESRSRRVIEGGRVTLPLHGFSAATVGWRCLPRSRRLGWLCKRMLVFCVNRRSRHLTAMSQGDILVRPSRRPILGTRAPRVGSRGLLKLSHNTLGWKKICLLHAVSVKPGARAYEQAAPFPQCTRR
jgi:hypothetical protein